MEDGGANIGEEEGGVEGGGKSPGEEDVQEIQSPFLLKLFQLFLILKLTPP